MATNPYIQSLLEANPLREPALRDAISGLRLPPGSRGLDVGCGIGLQTLLLADAVGPRGSVTGMDISTELLVYGEALTEQAGMTGRITFQQGSMDCLPFPDDSYDWTWSADCAGYPAGDLLPVLREMMRVTRPGGTVILLAWTAQQLLPGYPLLEARLNAHCSGYLPFLEGKQPEAHFLRAPRWMQSAGLEDIQARTVVGDALAPLSEGQRTALTALFQMLWGARTPQTTAEDWANYQRLCSPDSPDFLLNHPGYYAFFTYTIFYGKVPCK